MTESSDRLTRVETKLDALTQEVRRVVDDHEARLRTNERWRSKLVGIMLASGVVGAWIVQHVLPLVWPPKH